MKFCANTMEICSDCLLDVDTLYNVTFQGEDGEKGDGGARGFPGATVGSSKYYINMYVCKATRRQKELKE